MKKTIPLILILLITISMISSFVLADPVVVVPRRDPVQQFLMYGQVFSATLQRTICTNFNGRCIDENKGYKNCVYYEETEQCQCEYGYYPDSAIDWSECRDISQCIEGNMGNEYCWGGDVWDTYLNQDCSKEIVKVKECTYGCDNGDCTTEECIAGAISEPMCKDGDVRQKWQDDKCTDWWKLIDDCKSDETCYQAKCVLKTEPTQPLPEQPKPVDKTCGPEDGCVLECDPPDPDCGDAPTPVCDIVCTEECTQLNSISCECEAIPDCKPSSGNVGRLSQVCGEGNYCEEGLICEEGICKKAPISMASIILVFILIIMIFIGIIIWRKKKK